MLSAYLDWTHRATEQELQATVPHLWLVEHRAPGLAQPLRVGGITIPSRPCTTPACNRCTQLWGGYQFRWIDARWLDSYEKMRRPGSWSSQTIAPPSVARNSKSINWFQDVGPYMAPPQAQWLRCQECERQSTVECGRCRQRFCHYHLERHWYCCITPPDNDQADAFEPPAVPPGPTPPFARGMRGGSDCLACTASTA